MRNVVLLRDSLHPLDVQGELVAACCDNGSELLVLSRHGLLRAYDLDRPEEPLFECDLSGLQDKEEEEEEDGEEEEEEEGHARRDVPAADRQWFLMTVIAESGAIVCVSQSGKIAAVCVSMALAHTPRKAVAVLEGVIDTGIAAAAWSPDQTRLVLATGGDTLLSMSSQWDVLDEVPAEPRSKDLPCQLSWRGDGEQFALMCHDAADSALGAKVRVYSKELVLVSTGRNVAEGAGAALKGVGGAVSFATNGSLVACAQERVPGKPQVAFLEKNGLRHGDFDIRLPAAAATAAAAAAGSAFKWSVGALHWDLTSALLAVSLWDAGSHLGCVQLYHRGNYYWYLKQQWTGSRLRCLGFDGEVLGRLYLAHQGCAGSSSNSSSSAAIRVVDLTWDVACNTGKEATVAVVDGDKLLLTPFGLAVVPPPMSFTHAQLSSPCKHVSFWQPPAGCSFSSGMVSLLDGITGPQLMVHCLDARGTPMHPSTLRRGPSSSICLDLQEIMGANSLCVRAAQACQPTEDILYVCFLLHADGQDHLAAISLHMPSGTCSSAGARPAMEAIPGSGCRLGSWPSSSSGDAAHARADSVALTIDNSAEAGGVGNGCCVVRVRLEQEVDAAYCLALEICSNSDSSIFEAGQGYDCDAGSGAHSGSENGSNRVPQQQQQPHGQERDGEADVPLPLAETCTSSTVVRVRLTSTSSAASASTHIDTGAQAVLLAIGITARNRLYCGETLVTNGVSSYAVNSGLGVLMYCTVGTSPQLFFIPLQALAHIDPTRGIDAEDQLRPDFYAACFAPRPLERGARLVTTVPGEARVVVQQPRGNLETFEPRTLLLARARRLMDQVAATVSSIDAVSTEANASAGTGEEMSERDAERGAALYLECLQLLRRQRIDLNLLVDYRPATFMAIAPAFATLCLQSAHDVLSLLITATSVEDTTATKYPIPLTFGQQQAKLARGEFWTGAEKAPFPAAEKVNVVCARIRVPLLHALQKGELAAMQPVLCTYARNNPPLLEAAITTIRTHVQAAAPAGTTAALTGSAGQAAIKYLAFLADGQQLFHAALSTCDFDAARAVARQCQMDPKMYLPLIEGFEAPGRGCQVTSVVHAVVRMDVHVHLGRPDGTFRWGLCALKRQVRDCCGLTAHEATAEAGAGAGKAPLTLDASRICKVIGHAIKTGVLFETALPLLSRLHFQATSAAVEPISTESLTQLHTALSRVISDMRLAYGEHMLSKQQPDSAEAVASFLLADPPEVGRAITAALNAADWQTALALGARHASTLQAQGKVELLPKRVAADIISDLKVSLEQAATFVDSAGMDVADTADAGATPQGDKISQAAQLCVEYANDAEGAVRLLLLARRFEQASQLALRHGRSDLLLDDIANEVNDAAEQLLTDLRSRSSRIVPLNASLREGPWADPAARLAAATEGEPLLKKELAWLEAGGEFAVQLEETVAAGSDAQSDFSLASAARSDLSFISALSGMSSASAASNKSGSTTVSVLSDLKTSAEKESIQKSKAPGSQFSISGLDHSLLSRGTGQEDRVVVARNDQHARRLAKKGLKRSLRDDHRTRNKDSLGFNDESRAASELWACAQIPAFAALAAELCSVLALLGSTADTRMAGKLQHAMDAYTQLVRDNPAPVAPLYPRAWLETKQMLHVRHFQDSQALAEADAKGDYSTVLGLNWQGPEAERAKAAARKRREGAGAVLSWWQVAARGITTWHDKLRRVVLDLRHDPTDTRPEGGFSFDELTICNILEQ